MAKSEALRSRHSIAFPDLELLTRRRKTSQAGFIFTTLPKFCSLNEETFEILEKPVRLKIVIKVLFHTRLFWLMVSDCCRLLGRGSMFVFSHRQFTQLLDVEQSWKADLLLDIGAGDGAVTEVMSRHFRSVHVTELSPIMRRVLAGKGYKVLDAHKWMEKKELYDVISCLNVLDRCDRPLALLENMKNSLKTGTGRLILAIVLPVKQYVESGKPDNKPTEILPVEGNTFEVQVSNLYLNVIAPAGFEIVKWSRVPYLCEGDLEQSYYWLDDVVFVLKLKEDQLL
ncbi:protein-L-histidine N-pros-methyltransferase isoform X2 [Tachypleus tridentatus]|uniref:protein-L-histidine N-pros-methyltransferase isoform X2 n=1 Tax=Tachypleus tridentatus TaxID=6853 RepID=UPI003FD19D4F